MRERTASRAGQAPAYRTRPALEGRRSRRRRPIFPGKGYEDWELDDPEGLDLAAVRPIRDEIERRVR